MYAKFLRALSGIVSVLPAAFCLAAPPSIESLSTPILQAGQSAKVELLGAGMNKVQEIAFYSAGLRCTQIDHLDEYKLLASFEVNADCAICNHAFRLRGDDGYSELRMIRVGRFPVIHEESRASVEQVIELAYKNQTVSGTLQSGDYDRYGITLEKGQRLTAEVEAMRLGGTLLDTVLKVYDPAGKLLQASDDNSLLHQDPAVSFIATEAGRYVVELHETNYSGSSNSHYALHLGSFPQTRVAYPAGGMMGTQVQLNFLAVGQPNSDPLSQTIMLPDDDRGFQLFASDGDLKSASPTPFRLSSFPNVLEQEPNQTIQDASNSVAAPIAFNGILQADSDIDCFAFEAEQGQALQIDVFADRIGSPIDSYLQLYDDAGRLLAVNDDCDSNDSRIEFVAPEHGRYILQIRDKLYRGSSSGVYRIEVLPNLPRLTAFLPRPERTSQQQQTIAVPQGNRTLAKVAVRRENINGEVQLRFVDLPEGVRSTPIYVAPDEFWAMAILEADANAAVDGSLCGLLATTQTNDQVVSGSFEQTVDLIAESADRLYQAVKVDRVAVAVTPAMPFSIEVEQPRANLAIDGTIDLQIRLRRAADFSNPVRVEFPYLPDGCVGESFLVIDGDSDLASYKITATKETLQGDFKLAAIATISLTEGRTRGDQSGERPARGRAPANQSNWNDLKDREVASNLVELRIGPNPAQGEFFNLAAQQGESVKVECELRFIDAIPTKMICQLEGLPKGATAPTINLESNQTNAIFDLKIAADAPVGTFQGIQCRLAGSLDGSEVSFVVPSAIDLIITEPGKLKKTADGRVLSPLEALRNQNEK